jgi:uncharacterized membrane protein
VVDPHAADTARASLSAAIQTRRLCLALNVGLIALVIGWHAASPAHNTGVGLALTLPLWLPLHGLWRSKRRTFAWATLCVIPYFVIGTTEAVANPASRGWAGLCLALSLALFVALIAYLRLTRPSAAPEIDPS